MSEGPFTEDMVKHYVVSMQTREGIRQAALAMAKVLAEMGRASNKATGDAPEFAIKQWSKLMVEQAIEIVRADPPAPGSMREKLEKAKLALEHKK